MIYYEFVLSWTCESTFLVNPLLQKPLHTRMFVCFSLIWDQDLTSISAKFIRFLFSEHEIDDRSSARVSSVSWMMSFPVATKFFHHITLGKTQITYSFPSSCTNTNQSSSMHHIQIFERGVMPTDGSNQKCLVFCLKSCHKEGKYSQNLSAARLLETSVKDTADRCLFFLIGTVAIAMGLKLGWETESWIKARCPRAPLGLRCGWGEGAETHQTVRRLKETWKDDERPLLCRLRRSPSMFIFRKWKPTAPLQSLDTMDDNGLGVKGKLLTLSCFSYYQYIRGIVCTVRRVFDGQQIL